MKVFFEHCIVWIILLLARFLSVLPHRLFLFFVDGLALIFRIFDSRRAKDAMANLNFVYGDQKTLQEKKIIITKSYRNFAFVLLQALRAIYLKQDQHLEDFDFENLHYYTDRIQQNKNLIIISAHFGYWEAIGSTLPYFSKNYQLYGLGRLTQFQSINELIIRSRQAYGVKLINKKGALKQLLKLYTKPKQIAGILVDQNVSESEGIWVKFFDKEVTHTPVASILSRRFNIEILPMFVDFNNDYTRFKIIFAKPFFCPHTDNMQEDLLQATQQQAQVTQAIIEKNPSSYFWFHKRFKSKYPELYQ